MPVDRALSPDDAVAAVRSFPRRFRALLVQPADDDERLEPDELGRRIGPDGTSAADHVLAADGLLALLDEVLRRAPGAVARGDEHTLHPAFADLGRAAWDDEHTPVPALLDQLAATGATTAGRIESVPAQDWAAPARVVDTDERTDLLRVTQDVVGAVADHLRAAERVVDAVRHAP